MRFKSLLSSLLCVLVLSIAPGSAYADDDSDDDDFDEGVHKLVLQVSDSDIVKMKSALNISANVSRYYSENAEEVEIAIVVFNAGLDMVRKDKSPVADRLRSFVKGMHNVTFYACNNTIKTITKNEGKVPELLNGVEIIEAGVVTMIELHEKGYTVVKP